MCSLTQIAKLLASEADDNSSLESRFGAAFEVAIFSDGKFELVPSCTYLALDIHQLTDHSAQHRWGPIVVCGCERDVSSVQVVRVDEAKAPHTFITPVGRLDRALTTESLKWALTLNMRTKYFAGRIRILDERTQQTVTIPFAEEADTGYLIRQRVEGSKLDFEINNEGLGEVLEAALKARR